MLSVVAGLAQAATFSVGNETDLSSAISNANSNGDTSNTITLAGDIVLTGDLPALGKTGADKTLIVDGGGHTIDGNGKTGIFFANSGDITIRNVTLKDGLAKGGDGKDGGGGGMGAGGALFVRNGADVTIKNVDFRSNRAVGGDGDNGHLGGGGGLGEGGGSGVGGNGGGAGHALGGGGAGGAKYGDDGGDGNLGGGGGGGNSIGAGGDGGFGGGGGAGGGPERGGDGGFGGGGGGAYRAADGGDGGYGGGNAKAYGGGGAGFGGAVFVMDDGTLTVIDSDVSGGSVAGGSGVYSAGNGSAAGSGFFLHNDTQLILKVTAGKTSVISDDIASNGSASVEKTGPGALTLSGNNSYTGGTTLSDGTLILGNDDALGSGKLTVSGDASVQSDNDSRGISNAIQINTGNTLTVNGSHDLSLAGDISGDGSLTKDGGGTLTLTGNKTYSSGTTLSDGTLILGHNHALGSGMLTLIGDGAIQSNDDGRSITNAIDINANKTLTVNGSHDLDLSGSISGDGSLTKDGAGTLTLTGANSYTGDTTISGGALVGDTDSLKGDITDNAVMVFDQSDDGTYAGVISGTGSLSKNGAGVLTLTGANTYTGGTTVVDGALRLGASKRLAENGDVTVKYGATFDLNGNDQTIAKLHGNGDVKIGSGTLAFGGGNYTGDFDGSGTLENTGNIAFGPSASATGIDFSSGGTFVNSGTIGVEAAETATGVYMADGGTVNNTGTIEVDSNGDSAGIFVNGIGTVTNTGMITAGTYGIVIADGTVINGGTIDAQDGTAIQFGSGGASLILRPGSTIIGVVDGGSGGADDKLALGGDSGTDTFDVGHVGSGKQYRHFEIFRKKGESTWTLTGTDESGIDWVVNDGTLTGTPDSLKGNITNYASLVFDQDAVGTYAGVVSGSGDLAKTGTGELILNGANTYTGDTMIRGGTLIIGGDDSHAGARVAGNVQVESGAMLGGHGTVGGSVTVNGTLSAGNSPGTLTIGDDLALNTGSRSVFDLNNPGVVGGSDNDWIEVGGDLTLGGTLDARVASAGYYRLFDYDGTLSGKFDAENVTSSGFTVDRHQVLTNIDGQVNLSALGASQQMQFWDGNDTTGNGMVSGGAGTWSASNTNWTGKPGEAGINDQWRGSVGVFGGDTGGEVTVLGTQPFDTLQFKQDGYSLGGSGELKIDLAHGAQGTISVDSGVETAIGAKIVGAGSLNKTGGGTLTLEGHNSYTGGTTISAGKLKGNSISLHGNINIADDSRLVFDQGSYDGDVNTYGGVISGEGSVVKTGLGELTIAGANTYTGGTTITEGHLTVDTEGALGAGQVTNHGQLTFVNESSADGLKVVSEGSDGSLAVVSFDNSASAVGAMIAADQSTVVFEDSSSAADARIALTNGSKLALLKAATADGASITLDESSILAVGPDKTGGLTIGSLSGEGHIYLSGQTLTLGGNDTNDVISGVIQDNFPHPTIAAAVAGEGTGGALVKVGTGDLVLNGANTYTGGTTVKGGRLIIGGDVAHAGASIAGNADVLAGATLGGHGSIGGNVTVAGGARLAPGHSIGTLTIDGDLTVAEGGQLDFEFGAPGADFATFGGGDSVSVGGNLTLNGAVLNITNAGGFGPGLYRLFNYDGALTETHGGLTLGTTPGGTYLLQTLTSDKQINLFNTTAVTLNRWNGNGKASPTQAGGGDGTWTVASKSWTDVGGHVTDSMQPQPGFAVFGGDAGTVTVDHADGAVAASGLQFATDGYRLTGDTLTLVADTNHPAPVEVRVGDGSAASSGYTAAIANRIAGADGLEKTGTGTLILSGANTYTGGTLVSAGTLQGDTDSLHGDITDNARLVFHQNEDGIYDGVISGTGSLIKSGTGALHLTGANTYGGGTVISAGTLVGNTVSLQGDITDNAKLVFDQNTDGTYSGTISGDGSLAKTGEGELVLNGINTYTGGTVVRDGTLIVGSDDAHMGASIMGNVLVLDGATFGGHGAVGKLVAKGLIEPGNSIGTLTVNGDYVTTSGSVYVAEVDAAGHHDLIDVKGTATLNGGKVAVQAANGDYQPLTSYTILTADDDLNGEFDTVTSNLAFLHASLVYHPNDVVLTLVRNDIDFAAAAATPNQRAAAGAVGSLGAGNAIYDSVVSLTAASARQAFNALSGEYYASRTNVLLHSSHYLRAAVSNRLAHECVGVHPPKEGSRTQRQNCTGAVWMHTYGDWGHFDGNGNAARLDYNARGFFIGADSQVVPGIRLGFVAGYGHSRSDVDARSSHGTDDSYRLGLYAGMHRGALRFKAGVAHAWHDLESQRMVRYQGLHEPASANYNGHATQVFAEAGYQFEFGATALEPFVRASWAHLKTEGFTEDGGKAALRVDSKTRTIGASLAGLRLSHVFKTTGKPVISARGLVGWRHVYGDTIPEMDMAIDGQNFTVSGVPMARDALVIQTGLDAGLGNGWTLGASYAGQFGDGVVSNGVRANLAWYF